MPAYVKFHSFVEAVAEKQHNLAADTIKLGLADDETTPAQSLTSFSQIGQVGTINGYPNGGLTVTITGSSRALHVYFLAGNDVTFTASGGPISSIRHAVLYNDTTASDLLIGFWDYGSSVDLQDGESLTVDFGSAIINIL